MTDDPRLNYTVVPKPEPEEEIDGVILCPNEHMAGIDKYDMYVPLTEEDRKYHSEPLPLSFLQIKEGDVESGIQWYKSHYPKIPDELIELMARYNFGDLKYATQKSIKNNMKKFKKKNKGNKPPLAKGLTIKKGPVIVDFD
eukprot:SAG31_NODE_3425_length_4290_cov_171.943927_5_plen_141_part_00